MAKKPNRLVETAQRRAALVSWLDGQQNTAVSVKEIAEHFEWPEHIAAHAAETSVKAGLLHSERVGTRNMYSRDTLDGSRGPTSAPTAPRVHRVRSAKDVELVVAGVLVVVGRNAATGRLRITLEEV